MTLNDYSSPSGDVDVCPACGILLVNGNITDGCSDPSGCGYFMSDDYVEEDKEIDEDEEESLLEELDFG